MERAQGIERSWLLPPQIHEARPIRAGFGVEPSAPLMNTPARMNTPTDSTQSRREFLVAAAAAGIALSVRPVSAQTMIVTPSDGLEVGDTKITARDGTPIAVYFAAPQRAGKFPAVLVIPEIWGAHEHIKDVARRLAKAGYFALVVEPYTRIGDLTRLTEIKDVMTAANKLTDEQCFADLDLPSNGRANNRRQPCPTWHHRILPGWSDDLDVHRAQSTDQSGCGVVRRLERQSAGPAQNAH